MALLSKAIPPSERQSCEALRHALLADPSVYDCAVFPNDREGSNRFVAYIVPNGPIATERLNFRLRAALGPESKLLQDYVLVSSLPIGADGKVDEVRLSSLVVAGEEQCRVWENELRQINGIENVAIVSRNATGRWTPPTNSMASTKAPLHRVVWRPVDSRSYTPIWGDVLIFADGEGL